MRTSDELDHKTTQMRLSREQSGQVERLTSLLPLFDAYGIRIPAKFRVINDNASSIFKLKEKSIDLILTDPPYSDHTHAKLGAETRDDGWKVRDKLTFPPLTTEEINFLGAEFVRLSKGWILIFTDERMLSTWGNAIEKAGGAWIRTGHWVKNNPMPQMSGDRPAVGTEPILIAHSVGKGTKWNGRGTAAVWRGPRENKAEHPNQKPVWLLQTLLAAFGQDGDVILDPFFGSGSTAAAAFGERITGQEDTIVPHCPNCSKILSTKNQIQMPNDLTVIGYEIDPIWASKSAARANKVLTRATRGLT